MRLPGIGYDYWLRVNSFSTRCMGFVGGEGGRGDGQLSYISIFSKYVSSSVRSSSDSSLDNLFPSSSRQDVPSSSDSGLCSFSLPCCTSLDSQFSFSSASVSKSDSGVSAS